MQDTNTWVHTISLEPPSLGDNTADADRLIGALKKKLGAASLRMDIDLLRNLPIVMRENGYKVRAVVFRDPFQWRLVGIAGADPEKMIGGIAVDLGTSRIAMRLIDLTSGRTVGETDFKNPQIQWGPDILTRIHQAETETGKKRLQQAVITAINDNIARLCKNAGAVSTDIHLASIAGNTAMTHLLLGLPTRFMVREPYIPAVNYPGMLSAERLGLSIAPSGGLFVFPNIGSYFGGDLIAGILSSGMQSSEAPVLLVDVGTNAEVVLGNRDWLLACAGAAGPALESGVTRMGMIAGRGVIDHVAMDRENKRFIVHTIGGEKPRGICGSGLIDLAAGMFLSGLIDIRGKLRVKEGDARVEMRADMAHAIVVPAAESATGKALTVSQADFDSLIRSKAAMYTILEIITQTVGISLDAIETFYIAGTFGLFIDPESAVAIGMLPDLPRRRFKPLGNTSLEGATQLLIDPAAIDRIEAVRNRITYMELNVNQDFMNRFSAAKFLPHTDISRFPTVGSRFR